jgi:hypothetical protein
VFVHPPARTNPIPHKMRMRRGSFIHDMINVPNKGRCRNRHESIGVTPEP